MIQRHVVAMGGGGFLMEPQNPRLDRFVLSLARRPEPNVVFLATAMGDLDSPIRRFYQAFSKLPCRPTHLPLFERPPDLTPVIEAADVVYVGGGNTANLLAIWRVHGLDRLLRAAWNRGTVLAGVSAGALCWFEAACTDSFGSLDALRDGMGLLPGSCCPHFDGEPGRRPAYQRMIADGSLPEGIAIDDYAAAHFVGDADAAQGADRLVKVVASRPGRQAWWARPGGVFEGIPAKELGEDGLVPPG